MRYMLELFGGYGAIIAGLIIGSVAHFGRMLAEGRMPSLLQTIGYLMQLGLIGLVASVATRYLGIVDSDARALTTAIFAISAQEVIHFLKKRSWRPLLEALFSSFTNTNDKN